MFSWFSVISFVTMNLLMLRSFLLIHSREHIPRPLGCRQSLSWAVISIHQSLLVPQPLHKCGNCNIHKTTYKPFWAWINPHGTWQGSAKPTGWTSPSQGWWSPSQNDFCILEPFCCIVLTAAPSDTYLINYSLHISLGQGTINYAVTSEMSS